MSKDDLTLSGYPRPSDPRPRAVERWERPDDDYVRWRAEYERDLMATRRQGRRPSLFGALFLAAIVVGCIAFVVAPLFAFRAVRSAAQFGDVQALNESVDFDAVRQSLRVQVRPASVEARPPTSIFRNPFEAMRRAVEPVTPQADVNPFLTAPALAAMMSGLHEDARPPEATGIFGGPFPSVRYWGFDRARLGVSAPTGGAENVFTFARRGLFDWRLVGVKLPDEVPAPAARAPAP
jgi:hypothetical protein